jgi:hypothetical protein
VQDSCSRRASVAISVAASHQSPAVSRKDGSSVADSSAATDPVALANCDAAASPQRPYAPPAAQVSEVTSGAAVT